MSTTTEPKRTANHSAWKFVDSLEPFQGSNLRGEVHSPGSAPYLGSRSYDGHWLNDYEAERYAAVRNRIVYIVWSFYTPIAYFMEGGPTPGWYVVGQSFSSFTGRHRSGALRNVPRHRTTMTGTRGNWDVDCADCGTTRHFASKRDAEQSTWLH